MIKRRWAMLAVVCLTLALGRCAAAQDDPDVEPPVPPPPVPRAPAVKPSKMTQDERDAERVRQLLADSDDEWVAVRPMVLRVITLQNQLRSSRDKSFKPPKDGQQKKQKNRDASQAGNASVSPPTPEVVNTAKSLRDAIGDTELPVSELRQRVLATRQARAKVKVELTRAQDQLRDVVSIRQEATLIILGLLD